VISAPCRAAATLRAVVSTRLEPRAPAGRLLLGLLAAASLAQLGPIVGPGARSGRAPQAAPKARTIVRVSSLEQARRYGAFVDAQRASFERLDGTLTDGNTKARVAAFLEDGELRLIDERQARGEGGSAHNRYYVHEGRLVYYDSVEVDVRPVAADGLPARDEVTLELAYDAQGRRVGGQKTVNREVVPLTPEDEARTVQRLRALGAKVAAARSGAAS